MRLKNSQFKLDGIMVLKKPAGISSYQALACIKNKLQPARLGHTGTLDPFASGVLLLLFNQATRLADLFGCGEKIYQGIMRLGQATDTGDPTGQIVGELPVPVLSEDEVREAMTGLTGMQMQTPPMFSALKHQGKPLYRYARQGIKINKPPRQVNIKRVDLIKWDGMNITFTLVCESGVYVRAWAESLAEKLNTVGHLRNLQRVANGPFTEQQALSLDEAEDLLYEQLAETVIPCHQALAGLGLPMLKLDADKSHCLRQGMILPKSQFPGAPDDGPAYIMDEAGHLLSVVRFLADGLNKSNRGYETIRVFNRPQ
jgi:tRNA pseudouridine55 synthase